MGRINIDINDDVYNALKKQCKIEERTIGSLVRYILKNAVENSNWGK